MFLSKGFGTVRVPVVFVSPLFIVGLAVAGTVEDEFLKVVNR